MSKFPNIEKLGLSILARPAARLLEPHVILARDLENLLQSAQVVYEVENSAGIKSWLHIEAIGAKSKAILLCVEPIKKKTKAEAALEFVEKFKSGRLSHVGYLEAEKEAKRILEMKDEE